MSGAQTTPGGTQVTGGVGGTTFGMLSSIGSDLSVSVSFNIASELLDAAKDEQIAADELISLVLGFAIIFSAVQARLNKTLEDRRKSVVEKARSKARARVSQLKELHGEALGGLFSEGFVHSAEHAAVNELATKRSGIDFLALVVNILQRILVAISVQLLAASVRSQQESRLVRTVSLIGLAIFFVFVESLTTRHM
ncbi:MAG: hypothetical protein CMI29_06725 [Opitutae bacterium]|nr:hypothetical protein [Opitutae bacterium]|tara:strand:- start:914 stop:1501 length:588 start_codon:yes stop_codon:yes gene_type:complete